MGQFPFHLLSLHPYPYVAKGGGGCSPKAIISLSSQSGLLKVGCVTAPFYKCLVVSSSLSFLFSFIISYVPGCFFFHFETYLSCSLEAWTWCYSKVTTDIPWQMTDLFFFFLFYLSSFSYNFRDNQKATFIRPGIHDLKKIVVSCFRWTCTLTVRNVFPNIFCFVFLKIK